MLTFDQKLDSGEEGLGTRLVKPTANETEPCSQAPPLPALPALPGPSHIFCSTSVWEDLGTKLNHSWDERDPTIPLHFTFCKGLKTRQHRKPVNKASVEPNTL